MLSYWQADVFSEWLQCCNIVFISIVEIMHAALWTLCTDNIIDKLQKLNNTNLFSTMPVYSKSFLQELNDIV